MIHRESHYGATTGSDSKPGILTGNLTTLVPTDEKPRGYWAYGDFKTIEEYGDKPDAAIFRRMEKVNDKKLTRAKRGFRLRGLPARRSDCCGLTKT